MSWTVASWAPKGEEARRLRRVRFCWRQARRSHERFDGSGGPACSRHLSARRPGSWPRWSDPEASGTPRQPMQHPLRRRERPGAASSQSETPNMAKLTNEELLDAFKEMTLLELSEFVKQFEDTFGVTAAARSRSPRLAAPAARRRSGRGGPPRSTSSSSPSVTRRSRSSRRSARSPRSGLKEAKDLVESAPRPSRERAARRGRQGTGGPRGRRRSRHPQVTAG